MITAPMDFIHFWMVKWDAHKIRWRISFTKLWKRVKWIFISSSLNDRLFCSWFQLKETIFSLATSIDSLLDRQTCWALQSLLDSTSHLCFDIKTTRLTENSHTTEICHAMGYVFLEQLEFWVLGILLKRWVSIKLCTWTKVDSPTEWL